VVSGVEAELERLQGPRDLEGQPQQTAGSGAGVDEGDRIDVVSDDDKQADNDDEQRRHNASSSDDAWHIDEVM